MNENQSTDDPYKDLIDEQLLQEVFRKYGKKQKPGDPPLDSLPPSSRLAPHPPLTPAEENAILWADCRFFKIKLAPPDHPIYKTGWSISFVPPSRRHIPLPTTDAPSSEQPATQNDVSPQHRNDGGNS